MNYRVLLLRLWADLSDAAIVFPSSNSNSQDCCVLLIDPFPGKSADYLINFKTLLKMRMSCGVWENNKIKPIPSLLVYWVIIITGKTSWWVVHIDSLQVCGSAALDTGIINIGTRLTQCVLELCRSYCKCCLQKRRTTTDKFLLIDMLEEHLVSQGEKKKNKPCSKCGEQPIKRV